MMTDEIPVAATLETPPAPQKKRRHGKTIALVVVAALLAGGAWQLWQYQQQSAARRDANYLKHKAKKTGLTLAYKEKKEGKSLIWSDVVLSLPKGAEARFKEITVGRLRFDGGTRIEMENLAIALPEKSSKIGLKQVTVTDYTYRNGILAEYKTVGKGLLAEGEKIETLRGQLLGVAPLLLKSMSKEVQTLPKTLLHSLDTLSVENTAQYDEQKQDYVGKTLLNLPQFLSFSLDATLQNISEADIDRLMTSKLEESLGSQSPNRLFMVLEKLGKADYTVRLDNLGLVDKALALYGGLQGKSADEARTALLAQLSPDAAGPLHSALPPGADGWLKEAAEVLKGAKKTLVITATPTPDTKALLAKADKELKPKLLTAKNDKEQMQAISKEWWDALPEITEHGSDWTHWVQLAVKAE